MKVLEKSPQKAIVKPKDEVYVLAWNKKTKIKSSLCRRYFDITSQPNILNK